MNKENNKTVVEIEVWTDNTGKKRYCMFNYMEVLNELELNKSFMFVLPLLGIETYNIKNTYLYLNKEVITVNSKSLVIQYFNMETTVMDIPSEFLKDVKLLVTGEYSKISTKAKEKIVPMDQQFYPNSKKLVPKYVILNPSKLDLDKFKENMVEKYNVDLKDIPDQLLSPFNTERETFN